MTSGVPTPDRGKRKPRRSDSFDVMDDLLKSISSKTSVLSQPQITLTCYIPTHCVGAVIGRRGSTIAQIQRYAQQVGSGPVRVSIVGHENEEESSSSVPYTYSELDWSSPDWTPVVIRADPCAALAAAQRLEDMVEELDEVVMDVPISRSRHAALVGKRGVVLANLSADTNVRIMVPRKELRHDVIQLEGDLVNVKQCLEKVLTIAVATEKKKPRTEDFSSVITLSSLPSQTKLRSVGRKTDTIIKKKKMDDDWQLTVAGALQDQVQSAVSMLQKWNDEANQNGEPPSPRNTAPSRGPRNRGRQQGGRPKEKARGKKPKETT